MLTADTALEIWAHGTSTFYGHLHELTHTILVKHLERVYLEDLLLQVNGEEAGDVITRVAECHLCEVIGTK